MTSRGYIRSVPEYGAGLTLAIERGWFRMHESGSFVTFTPSGAESYSPELRVAMQPLQIPGFVSFSEAMMSNFVALIVEDDVLQREWLAALLKDEGLEVVECANGEVAELVLASTGPELRALVTDIELGGEMSGVQLAQYAKRKFPGLNVVMVSGHGPPYVPHGTHFLQKPYLPQQLLDAVLK